jgi:uncharacterized membrane protein HdeD (DUF308 family)
MSDHSLDDPLLKQSERSGQVQSFTIKYWWLNFVRGIAALLLGLGLLLPVEVIFEADNLQGILFQFIGIYLLLSGIMSLVWGLSNRRRFGLWILAAVLGLVGGIAFILRSFLEGYFSATVLTVIFGLIMLLAGLIHLLGGFRLGKAYGRRWSWGHEFLGLVEIAIGFLLLASIAVEVEHLRIILSFWGLVAGIGLIADGVRMRRLKKTAPTTALSDPNAPVEPK